MDFLKRFQGDRLRARALRGSAWAMAGYGVRPVLRLGSNLVLARLLFPEAFGLMALVQVLTQGLEMFSDVGIGPSIIQNERGDDPDFLNTAWTIQVIRGIGLWLIACLAAWPFARFYGEPMLAQLIPVAGLAAVIGGFLSTSLATAGRHLDLRRLMMLDLMAHVVTIVTMIGCAIFWRSVWALVVGGLMGGLFKMICSHAWLATFRNRFRWDRDASRQLVRFGKWIFVSTAVTFVASQADRIILGKLISIEMLGVYSLAMILAFWPPTLVSRIVSSVLFPVLSHHARQQSGQLREKLLEARQVILPVAMVMVLAVALFAPAFFRYLYDSRYQEAGWMAQLMCVSTWLIILAESSCRALIAIGRTAPLAAANTADCILKIAGCVAGFAILGLPGLIIGYAIGSAANLVVVHIELARSGLSVAGQDVAYTALLIGFLLLGGMNWPAILSGTPLLESQFGASIVLALLSLAGCSVWAAWCLKRRLLDSSTEISNLMRGP